MIFEIVLVDESKLPIFWRRPIEGIVSDVDPTFIMDLLGNEEGSGEIKGDNEVWSFIPIDSRTLIVRHDDDRITLGLIKKIIWENIDKGEQEILKALGTELLPTLDELDMILEYLPKEEFEIRVKKLSALKKIKSMFSGGDIIKEYINARLDKVVYIKPKNDVERLIRIASGALLNFMPPKYPAPSIEDLEKVKENISDEFYRSLAEALIDRARYGNGFPVYKYAQEHEKELIEKAEENPIIALTLIGPIAMNDAIKELLNMVKRKFSGTYWASLADVFVTVPDVTAGESNVDRAISILGTIHKEMKTTEEKFLAALKVSNAAEVLLYKTLSELSSSQEQIIEDVMYGANLVLESIDKDPMIFSSWILSVALSYARLLALVGILKYHLGDHLYKVYFEKSNELLDKVSNKIFEYLKYGRISPAAALVALSYALITLSIINDFLGKKPKNAEKLLARMTRYASRDEVGMETIYQQARPTYVYIATSFINAVSSYYDLIPSDMRDILADICKSAAERTLISDYAKDKNLLITLGFTLPKTRLSKEPSSEVIKTVLELLQNRIGNTIIGYIISAEFPRILNKHGFRKAAETACEMIDKTVVCERLKG